MLISSGKYLEILQLNIQSSACQVDIAESLLLAKLLKNRTGIMQTFKINANQTLPKLTTTEIPEQDCQKPCLDPPTLFWGDVSLIIALIIVAKLVRDANNLH